MTGTTQTVRAIAAITILVITALSRAAFRGCAALTARKRARRDEVSR